MGCIFNCLPLADSCVGVREEGQDDVADWGQLILRYNSHVKQLVEAVEVGRINPTGTAVLLGSHGNVWLYNPPSAVDPHHPAFKTAAALILKPGTVVTKSREIVPLDEHENAEWKEVVEEEEEV